MILALISVHYITGIKLNTKFWFYKTKKQVEIIS